MDLPIICPMCSLDVEHLLHVFFDCQFASQCRDHKGITYDMRNVNYAPEWLMQKLGSVSNGELIKIVEVFWGVWYWRNKRVWEGKVVTAGIATDWSSTIIKDWQKAKECRLQPSTSRNINNETGIHRWKPPELGCVKVNVDASVFTGAESFSVGMVLMDCDGSFIEGKTIRLLKKDSILEAKTVRVHEALVWMEMN